LDCVADCFVTVRWASTVSDPLHHVGFERARSAHRIDDQAAVLGLRQELSRLVDISSRWHPEGREGRKARELRRALDPLEDSLDSTFEVQPIDPSGAANRPKGENEAIC
jgi:hypothetical protein